eukprot:SAG31_NODE_19812_length_591_cov_0.863821_1_plen_31_part_10
MGVFATVATLLLATLSTVATADAGLPKCVEI